MSSVITNPISNVPVAPKSHTRGWTEAWSRKMGNCSIDHKCSHNILNFDIVYIDHGVNFGGTLNLFGGATRELFDKINLVVQCKNIVSLDIPMPDYGAMLKPRIGNKTTYHGITEEWCDMVSARLRNVGLLRHEDLNTQGITIGDSHSTAFAHASDAIFRNNGKTLFGTVKTGLIHELRGVVPNGKHINWCLGSIDIRHHILRYPDFDLKSLLNSYVQQADSIANAFGGTVSFCTPVPVEHEERKLPKTGYYKGVPFTGTRQQRFDLTIEFIERLKEISGGRLVMPPEHWYEMDPEKFAGTYMEFGGSVHLAPPYYRNKNWGELTGFSNPT